MIFDFLTLFILCAGYIIGLGAVTVIDIHGFLGRTSSYWTEATTRTHKVTKPLIWLGTILAIIGGSMLYQTIGEARFVTAHIILAVILILNGLWLSFSVSPFLLAREKEGHATELLPREWQIKITLSFIVSFIGWWSSLALFVYQLI
jgi:hypothetical protein